MKVQSHILVSGIISAILFAVFKSWPLSISAFISGIFIDIDHFIDYFAHKDFKLDIRYFFYFFEKAVKQKAYVLLHSWELVIIFFAAAFLSNWNIYISGVAIGFAQHMIFDQIFNKPVSIFTYSFIYRAANSFSFHKCFGRRNPQNQD